MTRRHDFRPERRQVLVDALTVGIATGFYAVAFGAIAVTSGASWVQAAALSSLMFTGGSQFAFVTILGRGSTLAAALAVAWLLGARNGLYAVRLSDVLPVARVRRLLAAQLVIDESTAMSVTRRDPAMARMAFWATGVSVYVFWNAATLLGALAGSLVDDPGRFGMDAAFPAAFFALLWPQLRARAARRTAIAAAVVSLALLPVAPQGVPVLACVLATVAGLRSAPEEPAR